MSATISYTETLTVVTCTCGINFAIPATLEQQLRDHPRVKSVYCPLGHQWHYLGKSAEQRVKEAEARTRAVRDQLEAEERSHVATRGHLTRQRRRAAAGVCPCCHRSFANVARHVASKHPDFEPEATP